MNTEQTEVARLKVELRKRELTMRAAVRNYESCKGMIAKAESDKHKDKQERIAARRRELATRTPAEWLTLLAGIQDSDTRIRAAQVVWWDWFSNVPTGKRTDAFDTFLAKFRGINAETEELEKLAVIAGNKAKALTTQLSNALTAQKKAVCGALSHIGYGQDLAKERMYGETKEVEA